MLLTGKQASLFTRTDVNRVSRVRLHYNLTPSTLQRPSGERQRREVRPQREGSPFSDHRFWTVFLPQEEGFRAVNQGLCWDTRSKSFHLGT